MNRNNVLVLAGAVIAAFAGGLLIGRATEGAGLPYFSRSGDQGAGHSFQKDRDEDAPRPTRATADPSAFAFDRLRLETNGDTPRACMQFTRDLDDSGKTNYADFVRLTPSIKPAVTVAGSSLCLSGLEFNTEYRARIRAGAPDAKGEKLKRAVEVTIAFGDKPAYVGFAGDGVILPRFDADGVGIETVNVSRVNVSVYRVSDRSLARKQLTKGEAADADGYSYVYGEDDGEDVGVKVFDKPIDIEGSPNDTVTTVFNLGATLPSLKPGAYFVRLTDVSPGADKFQSARAWRWVLHTDLALTAYSSGEGIDVIVRSIATGKPARDVRLELIAANNDQLAETKSGADGRARFAKEAINGDHPLTPRMIMAYGAKADFAALDLNRAPLDLSERGVDGRDAPGALDGYMWFDRGVYRPGETAHLSGMIRDAAGVAVDRPLTLTITRPNGLEAKSQRLEKLRLGGFSFSYDVPKSAARGIWRASVSADGVGQVAEENFSVEDFVPQRLDVKLSADEETPLRAGQTRQIEISSRYLYGAPAADLAVESEARLRLDPNPFPNLKGYRFGPADSSFDERFVSLPPSVTDKTGAAVVDLKIDDLPKGYGAPFRADIVAGVVEPGGRVVRESARVPVRPDDRYVGLKLAGDGAGVDLGDKAEIDAVLLTWQGRSAAGAIEWRIVEEDYWFDWYREDGAWRWRRSYKDVLVAEGRAEAPANGPVRIVQALDPGSYRLTATDRASGAKTDLRFYVGWRSYEAGAETPDQATLTLVGDNVKAGGKARLVLDPPYAGEVVIAVATNKVHSVQRFKVDENGRELTIDVDPDWGAGFYVLATIVTDRDPGSRPVPRRAMGVAYVPIDMAERTLSVSLGGQELLRPRQKVNVPVTIGGVGRGEEVALTIAAVDEGILRLTKFPSPDPVAHYFGKKRLGLEVRDDYGRILDANLGAAARFGGDQIGGEGLTVVPVKSIALFSGLVAVGADGKATVPLEIPDFNGELRLMAVAWSKEKVGALAQPLTVRDPVPALLSMPRFLAPGDTASATLLVDNVEGAAGQYRIGLAGKGPLSVKTEKTLTLAGRQQATELLPLSSTTLGVASVSLSVAGPGGFKVGRSYPIEVRSPYFPVTQSTTTQLAAGQSVSFDRSLVAGFAPGSTEVSVSFSRLRGIDPAPLLKSLYRYPYGCTEQLASTAMPLLYADLLGAEAGQGPELNLRPRVQEAVNRILERQGADGAFGLWNEGDRSASPWIGAYATDFLFRAKEAGYGVPENALEKSYDALGQVARLDRWTYVGYNMDAYEGPWSNDTTDQLRRRSAAYALYLMARAGRADLSDLRYFHDALLDGTASPLARAHIGAALSLMGDRSRAVSAFKKSIAAFGYENTGDYYQTPLRDVAGSLALMSEVQYAPGVNPTADRFVELMKDPEALHTQEKAFSLLAAQALLRTGGAVKLERDGKALALKTPAPRFTLALEGDAAASFRNAGDGPLYATVNVYGAPTSAPKPASEGLTIDKQMFERDGSVADPASVRQNDRLIVRLSGRALDARVHPVIIADLLPAGFEIETVLTPNDAARPEGGAGPYGWLGELSWTKVAEARDDRFIAAIDVYGQPFAVAYVVRAVTPGKFAFPGAVAEDMYRPGVFARTASSTLSISAAR